MKVREVMKQDPRCVYPETEVIAAARLMRDERIGVLPVCDGRHLVGIVTDRDIVLRHVAEGWVNRRVGAILSPLPLVVDPECDTVEARQMMAEHDLSRLLVCDEGELVGIVSMSDVDRTRSACASERVA